MKLLLDTHLLLAQILKPNGETMMYSAVTSKRQTTMRARAQRGVPTTSAENHVA